MDVTVKPNYAELEYWDGILKALESENVAERMASETELLRSGAGAVRVIYHLIGTTSEPLQERTACLLAQAGDALLEPLCSLATAGDPDGSRWASEVLSRIGEPAVRPLATLLRHDHPQVVRAASEALLRIGGSACETLQAALWDSSIKDRPTIIRTFRSHPAPWMVPPLCKLLSESDSEVGFDTSCILLELDEEILGAGAALAEARTLIPTLCRVLCDDEEALSPPSNGSMPVSDAREPAINSRRNAAAAVLKQFPTEVIRDEIEREADPALCHRLISVMRCDLASISHVALRVIWALGSLAADHLVQSLRHEIDRSSSMDCHSERQATVLLWLLLQCGDPRAIEVLCDSLTPGSTQFREVRLSSAVIKSLGQIRDARVIQVLARVLESENQTLRIQAAEALGQIGHRSALPALHRLLSFEITWGDPVVDDNWFDRLLTTRILTYEPDSKVRAAAKQAISLIEQTSAEIADLPIPAVPRSDSESSNLPRPAE